MNILFVCKHNRFRSKVAELLFRKHNKNKKIEVKSCGIALDLTRHYICKNVKEILREKGIEKIDEKAREINDMDMKWADKIIVVSNNIDTEQQSSLSPKIPKKQGFCDYEIFPKEKLEIWEIEDADESERAKIKKITNKIEEKVIELIKNV